MRGALAAVVLVAVACGGPMDGAPCKFDSCADAQTLAECHPKGVRLVPCRGGCREDALAPYCNAAGRKVGDRCLASEVDTLLCDGDWVLYCALTTGTWTVSGFCRSCQIPTGARDPTCITP